MPCFFVQPKLECLHCSVCGVHLGVYDTSMGTMKPNLRNVNRMDFMNCTLGEENGNKIELSDFEITKDK